MDAYSDYILQRAEAHLSELRREASEYGLSRAARANRSSRWSRIRSRAGRRPQPTVVALPRPAPAPEVETELRASA